MTGDRRNVLLAEGLKLFSAHAFDELSIDEIAGRLGIAKGLLYYYFGSKRGFYVAVVRAAAEDLRAHWDVDGDAAPAQRLADGVDAYLHYAAEHEQGYRAIMAGGIGTDQEVRAILGEERDRVIARVAEALGHEEPPPRLRTTLQGWMSFMEGATLDWLDHRDLPPEEVREVILGVLLGELLLDDPDGAGRGADEVEARDEVPGGEELRLK